MVREITKMAPLARLLLNEAGMKSSFHLAAALGVVAFGVALASSPLSAREMSSLGGSALRAVSAITEPGSLLLLGSVLAGLARVMRRPSSSN